MKRTEEHNQKISKSMKRYFENETAAQREKRRNGINEKNEVRRKFNEKISELKIILDEMEEKQMKL